MFSLGIRYLTGTVVATDPGNWEAAEWPPHPGRVFMALVAAWGQTGRNPSEAQALRWLEDLGSPDALYASNAPARTPVRRFVPVNDSIPSKPNEVRKAGTLQSAPALTRVRSGRFFPTVRPEDDRVFLIWDVDLEADRAQALGSLCGKVTRIGHSSSLVQMWVERSPPSATWRRSDENPHLRARSIHPGLLDRLQSHFENAPDRLPSISVATGYRRVVPGGPRVPGTIWDLDLAVLKLVPLESAFRHLDLVSTLRLTDVLHRASVDIADRSAPTELTGREPDGSKTAEPHVAFLPLAFTGHQKADGEMRGIALALPSGLAAEHRRTILGVLGRVGDPGPQGNQGLKLGKLGRWQLTPDLGHSPIDTLRASRWTAAPGGAQVWGSITPVAFDRHPKSGGAAYLEEVKTMMGKACTRIGLPEPVGVEPLPVSLHPGVPASREFPRMQRKDGSRRRHLHARLIFSEPVVGPIAIGAGRFRGYGFFQPVREDLHG